MILRLLTIAFLLLQTVTFGQWEEVEGLPTNRDHGIGFSINGYGYMLTGGDSPFGATKDFYKYDPTTDSWSQLPDYPGPNRGVGIGEVLDGKLYFGFGTDGFSYLNDLWEYDEATNTFTELASCPCQGRVHPALLAVDGKVYVGMGGDATGDLDDWWEYDIAGDSWTQKAFIPQVRHHPYQFVVDGEMYVGAGHRTTWYKYDVANDDWIQIAGLTARVAGAQFSYNGKGYALSGTDTNHDSYPVGQFWEYDPVSDTWTAMPNHPGTSRWAPSSFVIDNYVYLFGGYYYMGNLVAETTMWRFPLGPGAVSVDETEEEVVNSVYPNPATDHLNIYTSANLTETAITNVYNLSGQLVLSVPFSQQLDIANLTDGIYILDVVDEGVTVLKEKISKL
ncbi:MAG: T9SS type A sorting domain-containing protein [Crocinitomicaceae bacterium]